MSTIEEQVRALGQTSSSPSFTASDVERQVGRRRRRRRTGLTVTALAIVALVLVAPRLAAREEDSESVRTGPAAPSATTTVPGGQLYAVDTTVIEEGDNGPALCLGAILASNPPGCGGPPIIGWNWDDVGWANERGDVRWVEAHLVGTWDGTAFTLTDSSFTPGGSQATDDVRPDFSPACDEPTGDFSLNQGDTLSLSLPDGALPTFPGQVALYLSQGPPFVVNVVVTPGNGAAAFDQARAAWSGGLCVVERDAPTEAELRAVQAEVSAATAAGDPPLGLSYTVGADTLRGVVVVDITAVTDEARDYAHRRWGDLVELRGELTPVEPDAGG